ncbi:MAG: hypothetical protein AB7D36_00760 [Oscillospiraceae bacterium]
MSIQQGILIYALLLYAVLFGLEYYLAKQRPKWPGLILPFITFCMAIMNIVSYSGTGYGNMISNFFISNIITVLLLLLYFFQRRRIK